MYSSNLVLTQSLTSPESLSSRESYQGPDAPTVPSQPVPLLWWLRVSKADVSSEQRGLSSWGKGAGRQLGL